MIIPCIDLMGGKIVQLVQGREKALETDSVDAVLESFSGFRQIQVIDLDAAMGTCANAVMVEYLARRAAIRAGGGIRTVERAQQLVDCGAFRVIIGTATFSNGHINTEFLEGLCDAISAERITIALDSKDGYVVVKGWQESTGLRAQNVLAQLEPYCSGFLCTYVDKEGMMQGTNLGWFQNLRRMTSHELIAAGGITTFEDVKSLSQIGVHCAIGMSIYTGRLPLDQLRNLNQSQEQFA